VKPISRRRTRFRPFDVRAGLMSNLEGTTPNGDPYLQSAELRPVCMLPAVATAENCLVSSAQEERDQF
jgi:hypothetical protein